MPTEQNTRPQSILGAPRRLYWLLWLSLATACLLGPCWAVARGYRAAQLQEKPGPAVATVEVDKGDVALVVTETGVLESSVDDVVRCRVESFLRIPVGSARAVALPQAPQARAPKPVSAAQAKLGGVAGGISAGGLTTKTAGRPTTAGSSAFISAVAQSGDSNSTPSASRPMIRSFEYVVERYVPLRSMLPDQGAMATTAPPPLTIISILPEGSKVKAGDVVCELDSSLLSDALAVQKLRFVQAKAWVEQAKYSLEADNIALREYESGVFPQDIALVRQNVAIRQIEKEQAERNLAWARRALAKGFRTPAQVNADLAVLEQTQIALRNAQGMLAQLVNYTGKRIIKSRKARIQAIYADLLSLESSFRLEQERLKRIETTIANCKLRAPRDGTIVYANGAQGSGSIDTQIREGLIVHSFQPIFRLLDSHHMQVRARINESQIARIRPAQRVLIHLEAFPDRAPLVGSVSEIVAIPSVASGGFSDVRAVFRQGSHRFRHI